MAYMILHYVPTERNGISQLGCLLYMEARNYWVTVKYGGWYMLSPPYATRYHHISQILI